MIAGLLTALAVWLAWRPRTGIAGTRRMRRSRRPRPAPAAEVAHLLSVVQVELAAGSPPRGAWAAAVAGRNAIALPEVRSALALDGDLAAALARDAVAAPELALASLVTRVAGATGAGAAEPMSEVVRMVRDRVAVERTVAQEVAATRASVAVLAGLPFLGLAMGTALGSDLGWLVVTTLGKACLVGGLALECVGVLWLRHMVRKAIAW